MNYVLMMPVLNEQEHVSTAIESVIRQTVKPTWFFIIDGGSTDKTYEIISTYAQQYPWIIVNQQTNYHGPPGHKKISCAMVEQYNLMKLVTNNWYPFIGHIDGDNLLYSNFFENLIKTLESDPKLGVAGGILHTGGKPEIYPSDELPNIRLYRKEALDQIGGYPYSRYSWDSVILAKLRLAGWKIKASQNAIVINLREGELTRKNLWTTAVSFGKARYYLGYSLLLFLAGTAYATKNNGLTFGMGLMTGYFGSFGTARTKDEQIFEYYQNRRLKEIMGRKP